MKVVFIRTKIESTVFLDHGKNGGQLSNEELEKLKISAKAGSSSKNMILALREYGIIDECEEWKFWSGPGTTISGTDGMTTRLFHCETDFTSRELADRIQKEVQPNIIWVEGTHFPPYLKQIFSLLPTSFKIIYSKDWKPWKVQGLENYDFCLVDEAWQIQKIKKHCSKVRAGVWDKLIDYEKLHVPLNLPKIYDVCYVAYFRARKKHELLFESLARLNGHKIRCVCVGADRQNRLSLMRTMAQKMGLDVTFMGEISKEKVNVVINQSRMGVMCAEDDAAPRVILEYMAADVPVLVNEKLLAGARYVGKEAGQVRHPDEFHVGIKEILSKECEFHPRQYLLENFSKQKVVKKFLSLFQELPLFKTNAVKSDFF